jgi:hypothetical protein
MKMTRADLKKAIQDNKDTIEDLRQYGPLDTKTIDSMRLFLFTATAIDRLLTIFI